MITDDTNEYRRVRPRVEGDAALPSYDDLPSLPPPTYDELEYMQPNPAFRPIIDRIPQPEPIDDDIPDFTYVQRRDPRAGRGPGWAGFGPFQPRDEL